jgi:hypothetical protein
MSIFTGTPQTALGLPYATNDQNPQAALGQVIYGDDGRKYVYALAGASGITPGLLYQSPAQDTGDQNIAAAAAVAGPFGSNTAGQSTLVTAAMTVTANQYAGGYVIMSVTPGLGMMYRIKQHAAFSAAAATFLLEDTLQVTLTTSTRLDFVANPENGVIPAPSTLTSSIVGFGVNTVTAGYYGWLQTEGPGPVTNDAAGAITVGVALMPSASVAGAVRLQTAGNVIVAQAMTGIASGETAIAKILIG